MKQPRFESFNRKYGLIPLLVLTNAVFFALYFRFLRGSAVYLYTDIGSDSVTSSLPILSMLQRLFAERTFFGFDLSFGLGTEITSLMMKYINPMKLPLLFFSGDKLPLGLFVEMAIQTNVIAIAAWLFFVNLLDHGTGALFAALSWTFCGYITLWSQNLTIGSCMAMFTLVMAAILPAMRKVTLRRCLVLALALTLSLLTNYYFTYMTGLFAVVFFVFLCIAEGLTFTNFLVHGLAILGSAVFSVGLAAVAVIPSISGFLSSVRTTDVTSGMSGLSVWSVRGLLTSLGRLLSVNTVGGATTYTGVINYYEAAALSTSVLIVYALVYLLIKERTRALTIAGVALACAVLYVKNFGKFIQFNGGVQRFSFMIAFAACIAIGTFQKMLVKKPDRKALLVTSLTGLALTGGFVVFFWKMSGTYNFTADLRTLKFISALAVGFAVLLALSTLRGTCARLIPIATLLFLCVELVVMNYDTLYSRIFVTKESFDGAMQDYGIGTAALEILEQDDSLYRISGAAESDYANSGMLCNFPGTSVYSNTNPASLSSLVETFGACQLSANHLITTESEFGLLSFLSGKYLIKSSTGRSTDTPTSVLYSKIGESADGSKVIFENNSALPFGYLYTEQVSAAEVESLSLPERILLLTRACFRTDGISGADDDPDATTSAKTAKNKTAEAKSDLFLAKKILTKSRGAHDVKLRKSSTGINFKPTGGDPYVYYDIGASDNGTLRILYMKLGSTAFHGTRQMQIYFMSEGDEAPDGLDYRVFAIADGYPEVCLVLPDDVTTIRLDFPQDRAETLVTDLSILTVKDAAGLFEDLQSTQIENAHMTRGTYTATLTSDEGGMLCIPLLYSGSWKATVNGKETSVLNINGGLVGVRVNGGTEEIVLTYSNTEFYISLIITLAFLVVWVVLFVRKTK